MLNRCAIITLSKGRVTMKPFGLASYIGQTEPRKGTKSVALPFSLITKTQMTPRVETTWARKSR